MCVDGQYDSPGFCAEYCTVVAIERTTEKAIAFTVVTRAEANGKSAAMEPIGVQRVLDTIINTHKLQIQNLIMDNNKAVGAMLRREFPLLSIKLDVWHITHNLVKRMRKVTKFFVA